MAKRKIIRRQNKPYTFAIGGALANAGATAVSGLINPSGNSTGVGNAMQTIGSVASNIPGVGGLIGAGVNMLGGVVNAAFGSKINKEFVDDTEASAKQQSGYVSGASTNDQLLSDWSNFNNLTNVTKSQVGSDGWFSSKAKRETRRLNKEIDNANLRAQKSLVNTAGNIDTASDSALLANYAANGGYMGYNYDETFAPTGTLFQGAWDSLTTHPDALTHDGVFSDGVFSDGVFSDGVIVVGEGGSHEENPLSGVPMGLAPDGQPNLVEEGEVVFNDYVFSNRLHPTEKMLKQYNIPLKYKDHTFASIAEKFNKEPKERPNDPIAKRGLLANMGKLMQAQEEVRAKKEARQGTQFALGGFTNANDDTLLYGNPFTYNDFLGSQGSISNPNNNSPSSDEDGFGASWLRYAPVVGSGISALASLRDKPNYAGANAIGNVVANMSPITATPIGNKLRYTPLDREFYLNRLDASAGATRRAVNNNAGGNRGTAMAGILAADYNYGQNLGNFARQAEDYNQAQKERVEGFNRQTDMFNSEAGLKAAAATQGVKEAQLRGIIEEYNMRNAERNRVSANRSANLTGFFDNLGEVGREEFIRNQIQSNPAYNYNLTRSGKVKYKGNKKGGKNG